MCQLLSLMLDFFWQIFQFTFFSLFFQGRVSVFFCRFRKFGWSYWQKLFHSYFRLSYISCLFLNSTCFKACFENHSRIFINKHLRGNFLALDWVAISFWFQFCKYCKLFFFKLFEFFFTFCYGILFSEKKSFSIGRNLYKWNGFCGHCR